MENQVLVSNFKIKYSSYTFKLYLYDLSDRLGYENILYNIDNSPMSINDIVKHLGISMKTWYKFFNESVKLGYLVSINGAKGRKIFIINQGCFSITETVLLTNLILFGDTEPFKQTFKDMPTTLYDKTKYLTIDKDKIFNKIFH